MNVLEDILFLEENITKDGNLEKRMFIFRVLKTRLIVNFVNYFEEKVEVLQPIINLCWCLVRCANNLQRKDYNIS